MIAEWILQLAADFLKKQILEWFPGLDLELVAKIIQRYAADLVDLYERWASNPDQLEFELGQLKAEIKQFIADFEAGLEGGNQ